MWRGSILHRLRSRAFAGEPTHYSDFASTADPCVRTHRPISLIVTVASLPSIEAIVNAWNSSIRPHQILTGLHSEGSNYEGIIVRDSLNLLAVHRSEQLGGKTPIEWLFA
ncbi:hypothetical protein CH63R_14555 [Colletotrichum higginsianum IMI 349063]|uniref:Uncharacterized protein n=1 Tax=Colletotrichum higginsianum (strain IMI 349063) TaxID=759273 RepID=A0A1B7XQF0_COLHI|nr:hypothetical protein CH63R_14555 [Colletotrichum higginsianum IMI 349063]OBR01983.1 hypothetical protein CH63R_14555 [Colletotrichum higginsianum IMI 349063]